MFAAARKENPDGGQLKRCPQCGEWKPHTSEDFYRSKNSPNGLDYLCKVCKRVTSDAWKAAHREKVAERRRLNYDPEVQRQRSRKHYDLHKERIRERANHRGKIDRERPEIYFRYVVNLIAYRCRKDSIPFDLDRDFLVSLYEEQGGVCSVTAETLTFITGQRMVLTNPSVDRIDPNGGYLRGNVQITTLKANMVKQKMTMEEFVDFCRVVIERWDSGKNTKPKVEA